VAQLAPAAPAAGAGSAETCAIALTSKELDGELPNVCLCCGAPAVTTKAKTFLRGEMVSSVPSTGIIGTASILVQLVQSASERRHVLHAPFCAAHANHWSMHTYSLLASLAVAAFAIGGLIIIAALGALVGPSSALAVGVVWVLGLFMVGGLAAFVRSLHVRQMDPNPDVLFLCHVSPAFRDALARQRQERGAPPSTSLDAELESMRRRHNRRLVTGALVLPVMATFGLAFVGCALAVIAPPSVPLPAGGPRTRGNDEHCYKMLRDRVIRDEARSRLNWHSSDTVEGWDRQTTVTAVEELYKLGATKVYHHPVVLVVILPQDAAARGRILAWEHDFVRKSKGDPIPDEQQNYLLVAPPH
jgi:hypothetical protein